MLNNLQRASIADASNMQLLQQLEQKQHAMDEAEVLLAEARARCSAAESRFVNVQIERWKSEVQLVQICSAACIETQLQNEAWQNRNTAERQITQAVLGRDAAQANLEQAKSIHGSIASELVQLNKAIEDAWNEVHAQLALVQHPPVQPQEELAVEHKRQEPEAPHDQVAQQIDQFDREIEQLSEQLILTLGGHNPIEMQPIALAIDENENNQNHSFQASSNALLGSSAEQAQDRDS